MSENIEEMRKRHEKEIKDLQNNCEHPEDQRSEWMDHWWAIGHSSGFQVKICNFCGKQIDKKEWCGDCGNELRGNERYQGDGSSIHMVHGVAWCKKCYQARKNGKRRRIRREQI
jgi:hypothetical protein